MRKEEEEEDQRIYGLENNAIKCDMRTAGV